MLQFSFGKINTHTLARTQQLKALFSSFGKVQSVRFRSVAFANPKVPRKAAFINGQFHQERDSMNAYVVSFFLVWQNMNKQTNKTNDSRFLKTRPR